MAKACVLIPKGDKNAKLFLQLKDSFGRQKASFVYNRVITEEFQERFRDSLVIEDGVPTYQSVINNTLVKAYLRDSMLEALNKKQLHLEDTFDNVSILMNRAVQFNNDPTNRDYIAFVDYDEDSNITVKIESRTPQTVEIAENQQKIYNLNKRIAQFLAPAGVTIGHLSEIETAVGRVGLTNFNHLKEVIGNFSDLIKIANNMEGYKALSEEFAHLIVGINRNRPIVERSINALLNEEVAREVLGDRYQEVFDYYNGDTAKIAEEALGQILRDKLVNHKDANRLSSLFNRAINYIVNLFKGYNPAYVTSTIDYISSNMSDVAKQYLDEKRKITKKDIQQSEREVEFNALSEKGQIQMETLKKLTQDAYKRASLLAAALEKEGVNPRKNGMIFAKRLESSIKKNLKKEATVVASYEYLKAALKEIEDSYHRLSHLEDFSRKDQATILRNAHYTLQLFGQNVKELKDVFTSKFLEDEDIASQLMALGDTSTDLKLYETTQDEKPSIAKTTEGIIRNITVNAERWSLAKSGNYYRNSKTSERAARVTSIIKNKNDEEFDKDNPWYIPSTNIGTGIDEMVRAYLAGDIVEDTEGHFTISGKELDEVFPNVNKEDANNFVASLKNFVTEQEAKGIKFVPRDVVVNGTIITVDESNITHKIRVAGTLDLLGYDNDGNFYVYDIKTYRTDIDSAKMTKYTKQVSLYKKFLEDKYGIKIKETAILPVKVQYPDPKGVKYEVNTRKSKFYPGKQSNQLQVNGENYTDTKPVLEKLRPIEPQDLHIRYEDLQDNSQEGTITLLKAFNNVNEQLDELRNLFEEKKFNHVKDLFTDVLGENATVREIENNKFTGRTIKVSIENLLKYAPIDNDFMSRFLVTYQHNPDQFIQAVKFIVTEANDKTRQQLIDKSQEIIALGIKYEKLGIKDYDWMFEGDKQNYINHLVIEGKDYSYDLAAYKQAKADFVKQLDEKYGEHPEIGTEDYKNKNEELNTWINQNTTEIEIDGQMKSIPMPSKYPSRYNSLTQTQKDFYNEWMAIKEELDSYIPKTATHTTNTIKIRKSGYQRLKSFSGIKEFVEATKANFIKSYDDDMNYIKGVQDFDGEQVNRLPLLYLRAKDASDVTTDVIGSLVAYAGMCYNYNNLSDVVDSLELARLVAKQRKVRKKVGKFSMVEKIPSKKNYVEEPLYINGVETTFYKVLTDLLNSKVYGKTYEDEGDITIGKTDIDKHKAANAFLSLGRTALLGFNVMAQTANVLTGKAMQRIDAASGEHFRMRDLRKADRTILKELPSYLGDVGKRVKKSKLALFDEMLNVKQDTIPELKHTDFLNKNFLTRVFGPSIQFLLQECGDWYLYNRNALAIADNYMLLDANGNEISYWDALQEVPIDPENPEAGNKLVLKEGVTKLDGSEFTSRDRLMIEEEIRDTNHNLFGVYDDESRLEARRWILGKALLQFRDFLPAQMNYRFAKKSERITKGGKSKEFEGYYRTYWRFLGEVVKELKQGELHLNASYYDFDEYEIGNIKRARFENIQLLALYLLSMLVRGLKGDDKKAPMALKYFDAILEREKTELGVLTPFNVRMPKEFIKIAKSPAAATNVAADILDLTKLVNPRNYVETLQSGSYKGHSKAFKTFMDSPLTLWYRTIRRQLDPDTIVKGYRNQ